jgi:hypothetical protein
MKISITINTNLFQLPKAPKDLNNFASPVRSFIRPEERILTVSPGSWRRSAGRITAQRAPIFEFGGKGHGTYRGTLGEGEIKAS